MKRLLLPKGARAVLRQGEDVNTLTYKMRTRGPELPKLTKWRAEMTREEIEMKISLLEDKIAELNNQIEEYERMLEEDDEESEEE